MVEQTCNLDLVFTALSDSTRRSILGLGVNAELSIGEIAEHFRLTFGAISKHIKVLEMANLIVKKRRGKEQIVVVVPRSLGSAREQIEKYEIMLQTRFDALEQLVNKGG